MSVFVPEEKLRSLELALEKLEKSSGAIRMLIQWVPDLSIERLTDTVQSLSSECLRVQEIFESILR